MEKLSVVLSFRTRDQSEGCGPNNNSTVSCESNTKVSSFVRFLVRELEEHYLTAKADMMLAARTKPIHGEYRLRSTTLTTPILTHISVHS